MTHGNKSIKIVVTLNGREGAAAGMKILREGGSALDAVENAVRTIEDNPDDWSVGPGGFPNIAGVVELDAAIMDGKTLKAGAVAGIRRHRNPISIARRVMDKTPHVMLIGDGADRFADSEGFEPGEIITDRMRKTYEKLMAGEHIELWPRIPEESPERALKYGEKLMQVARDRKGWREIFCAELQGTCNAIAIDKNGDMAVAVSTSGLALKIPGRVGDSPIPGAGGYCDNRYGGAGCVGNGELCMRLLSARMAVLYLEQGATVTEAAGKIIRDQLYLADRQGGFQVIVMDRNGNAWCASNIREPEYYSMEPGDAGPRRVKGTYIELT